MLLAVLENVAPPPLTRLEQAVLDHADFDVSMSFDEQCENVRRWLRSEIENKLREVAKTDTVELVCGVCGSPTDVSRGHALKVAAGSVPPPKCFECRRPERDAEAEAEAVAFVAALGDQAPELAGVVAALR